MTKLSQRKSKVAAPDSLMIHQFYRIERIVRAAKTFDEHTSNGRLIGWFLNNWKTYKTITRHMESIYWYKGVELVFKLKHPDYVPKK